MAAEPVTISQVRAWATEQPDIVVGKRGRLSQAVVDAYNKAHPRKKYTGPI